MAKTNLIKVVVAAGLTVACVLGLSACGSNGVAATVNGKEIKEEKITNYIESIRSQSGLEDEDTWAQWLVDNDLTPSGVREEMIDSFADELLIASAAEERGATVDDSTVDYYVESMKSNYSTDEAWQSALESAGFTEDEYRETIKTSLLQNALLETFADEVTVDEDTALSYAKMYTTYYDGAKRSSHILFAADDEATAQQVLDQINAGTLSFEDAAKQYSTDTGSAENGGDVGWDALNSFVTEYTTALDELSKGEVSGLVTSSYGIHIIKCTDVFEAPDEVTSMSDLPEAFQESFNSMAKSSAQQSAYSTWFSEFKENANIVINDMPSGLPYDVDLSGYTVTTSSSSTTTTTTTDSSSSSSSDSSDSSSSSSSSSN